MPLKTLTVQGKRYKVYRSNRKGKKFKVEVNGKVIHFGAKGYSISPGTKKGDKYCTRSSGIKGTDNILSANFWSRRMWRCKNRKSLR